jgi:hypothetical protein
MQKYDKTTIQALQKRLPELNSIDKSINKYTRALMTEIPTLKKVWNGFAHLHFRPDIGRNGYIRCTNSLLGKVIEDQQTPEDWKFCSHIIEFNTVGNYAKIYPNTQDFFHREENMIFIRMSKIWNEYEISRDEMETWKIKTVKKFNMVKHKNGETSELECFVKVNLVGLLVEYNKHNIELKRKDGKQGLKVHICFENANGYKEETKTALDAYKIIKSHTDYKFQLRKFHNDLKANCADDKEWRILSKNKSFCIILSLPCINYKYIYKNDNNKNIIDNENNLFIVNAQGANDKPIELWSENYEVGYPPRKIGTNSKK